MLFLSEQGTTQRASHGRFCKPPTHGDMCTSPKTQTVSSRRRRLCMTQKFRRKSTPISNHRGFVKHAGQVRAGTHRSNFFLVDGRPRLADFLLLYRIVPEPFGAHTVRGGMVTFCRQLVARLVRSRPRTTSPTVQHRAVEAPRPRYSVPGCCWQNRWTHWSRFLQRLRSPDAGGEGAHEAKRATTAAVTASLQRPPRSAITPRHGSPRRSMRPTSHKPSASFNFVRKRRFEPRCKREFRDTAPKGLI